MDIRFWTLHYMHVRRRRRGCHWIAKKVNVVHCASLSNRCWCIIDLYVILTKSTEEYYWPKIYKKLARRRKYVLSAVNNDIVPKTVACHSDPATLGAAAYRPTLHSHSTIIATSQNLVSWCSLPKILGTVIHCQQSISLLICVYAYVL
jgi:transposase InsO family protein